MSEMRWSNEMASGCIDAKRDTRGFGAGGFGGARPTQAKESAAGTALVAISEDASGVNGRCILREFAVAFAGAYGYVCPRHQKSRGERMLVVTKRRSAQDECG